MLEILIHDHVQLRSGCVFEDYIDNFLRNLFVAAHLF